MWMVRTRHWSESRVSRVFARSIAPHVTTTGGESFMSSRAHLYAMAVWCMPLVTLWGQTADTLQMPDTAKPYTLRPITVSVTRAELPFTKVPLSIRSVDRQQISRARPTWGLDEALAIVPGVF